MKIMFVEAKKKLGDSFNIGDINLDILPDKVFLVYSIQYKQLVEKIRKKLGKKITGFKQVLGCSKLKTEHPILLIGSGCFHALQLALQGNIVHTLEGNQINKIEDSEIKKIKDKRKTSLSKFLSAEKIGILVSIKLGQENLKKALKLKRNLEKKEKQARIFLADNINLNELENYNIESWINTSCPALTFDSRIVHLSELENL